LPAKVVERADLRRLGPGDDHLVDRPAALVARYEIHFLEPLIGDGEVADRHVRQSGGDIRQELVARGGRDVDRQRALAELLGVLDVEVALPVAYQLDRDATLAALVAEVERARERRIDADHSTFEQLVEVAGPRLVGDPELARHPVGRVSGPGLATATVRREECQRHDGAGTREPAPSSACERHVYCLAMASWNRSSAPIKWSASLAASSTSMRTQPILPLNALSRGP
jgi:hypothetical protein